MLGEGTRSIHWPRGCAVCVLAGAGAISSPAHAQQIQIIERAQPQQVWVPRADHGRVVDPEAPARLRQIVEALASGDGRQRIDADRQLSEDRAITLPMIEQALTEGADALPLDIRMRLLAAARTRFDETPRGAMGIQFWQSGTLRDRVVIEKTIPNFDSVNKIEEGDMVIEADGQEINGPNARNKFQSAIVARDPGDLISLVLRRGEQKLNVQVRMGRRDDLGNSAPVFPELLDRAWKVRSARIAMPAATPIAVPLTPEQWSPNPPGGMRMDLAQARMKGVVGLGPTVKGGGMPRGASETPDASGQRLIAGNLRRNGQVIINGMVWQQGFDPMPESKIPAMTLDQELTELLRARAMSGRALERPAQGPVRRPLPDVQAGALRELVDRETQIIDKQIAAIRAEMAEAGIVPREGPETVGHDDDVEKPEPPQP